MMLIKLLFIVFFTGVASLCRLSIPNSGGASQRPASFDSLAVVKLQVLPDIVIPGEGIDAPAITDYCAGNEGCAAECCKRDDCFAWGYVTGGSVHAACGSNTCEIFITYKEEDFWTVLASKATLYGGYNVGGYIYNNKEIKDACCLTGEPPTKEKNWNA